MIGKLNWQLQTKRLVLQGDLDRDTLLPLWQQRNKLLNDIDCIDITPLQRVDSAGLALLVHLIQFKSQQQSVTLAISGISDQLATLIKLYNLQQIISIPAVLHVAAMRPGCETDERKYTT